MMKRAGWAKGVRLFLPPLVFVAMSAWGGIAYRVAGSDLTLNQIEDQARALGDWRVHFALVCASESCPPIRSEAYQPEWLDAQLTEQLKAYLPLEISGAAEGKKLSLKFLNYDWLLNKQGSAG